MKRQEWDAATSVDAVDSTYLTRVLEEAGYLGARVESFIRESPREKGFGGGNIQRFWLEYSHEESHGAPQSIILKQFHPSPVVLDDPDYTCREANCYAHEIFDQLSSRLHVPHNYHTVFRPEDQQCWIWMEDLGEAAFLDTWTPEHVQRAVQDVAYLHASWWGRKAELKRFSFLKHRTQAMFQRRLEQLALMVFDSIAAHPSSAAIRSVVTPERQELLLKLQDVEDNVYAKLDALPQTLLHQDFWNANVGFYNGKTALIDWSLTGMGTPGAELSMVAFFGSIAHAPFVLENDKELLVETLWRTLHRECELPIDYQEVLRGYQLAYTLRPSSMIIAPFLKGLVDGVSPLPGDDRDFSNTEFWLAVLDAWLKKLEEAAAGAEVF